MSNSHKESTSNYKLKFYEELKKISFIDCLSISFYPLFTTIIARFVSKISSEYYSLKTLLLKCDIFWGLILGHSHQ